MRPDREAPLQGCAIDVVGSAREPRRQSRTLLLVGLASLLINADSAIVNAALPSIGVELGFSQTSLVWVVNAYLLTFGGFMLLAARLVDLFGHRRLFVIGISLFTLTSVACGMASSPPILIVSRAGQGLAAAVVSAVAVTLAIASSSSLAVRARAIGVIALATASGSSIGVLVGGVLTEALSWRAIFLVNVPSGVALAAAGGFYLSAEKLREHSRSVDVPGALTITLALTLAVYCSINSRDAPPDVPAIQATIVVLLLALFVFIERRSEAPLIPLGLFRHRNLVIANLVAALWSGAALAWAFFCTLYLQVVLGYGPSQVGLAFLPANLITGVISISVVSKVIQCRGIRATLAVALVLGAAGLMILARAPAPAHFAFDVMPAMLLLGASAGLAATPLLLAATAQVDRHDIGAVSGIINTTFLMGGSVLFAIVATVGADRTNDSVATGVPFELALVSGYRLAFLSAALLAVLAVILSLWLQPIAEVETSGSDPPH